MPITTTSDLSQVSFDSDTMQVLSVSGSDKDFVFPLIQGPINFSVVRSDGLVSNRWGVTINQKKGDAYVYSRDVPDAEKVSLHASGRQHISITSETAKRTGADYRFGPVWTEPQFDTEAVATFTLVFPPWGVGRDASETPVNPSKDELLIIGHKEKLVLVSFFIVDAGRNMRGRIPHFALAQLSIREGKTLHMIAWKEPQNGLMDRVRATFPQISSTFSQRGHGEDDYTLCLSGFRAPNSAYMVVVPVKYTASAPE